MDFTYVRAWAGWVYVAFIIDVVSQRIVAWHAQTSKHVDLVMIPLRMGLWERDRQGRPVQPRQLRAHSDAGSPGGFNWSSQHLAITEVGAWIEDRYNRRRRHASIGQIGSAQFEIQYSNQTAARQEAA